MQPLIVLSHYQINPILRARANGDRSAAISPDLNLSTVEVTLNEDGITFPNGAFVNWADADRIASAENACFKVCDQGIDAIQTFSEVTGWSRSLFPTESAPTVLVSGITMHRIKRVDPHQDTLNKIKAAAPLVGRVLDTATGLGYTAIEAAKSADHVVTIELDPSALEICGLNPWSQALFNNPKIEQQVGDAWDIIEEMEDGQFSRIIHDPPAFNLAGDLYSGDFYRELYRVLTRRGYVFHYIGDPESKSGAVTTRGVIKRLGEAGFTRIDKKPQAFGVVAHK